MTTRRGHLAVVLAALCFGSTFPVTKEALGDIGPYAVVGIRFLLGGVVLLPFALRRPGNGRTEAVAVAWASLWLCVGYVTLTVGLQSTTSTAAAFICYLLVVIVPVLSAVVLRTLPSVPVAAGVVLATVGLFLLAGDGLRLGTGELLVLACAFAFAVHILVLDHFVARRPTSPTAGVGSASEQPAVSELASEPSAGCLDHERRGTRSRERNSITVERTEGIDVIRLAAFQLSAVGVLALLPAALRGELRGLGVGSVAACAFLAAAGVGGLVLQITGQQSVGPTRTSLLLMIEPVLAAVGGYLIGERIAPLGFVGAALILIGIVASELPLDRPVNEAR